MASITLYHYVVCSLLLFFCLADFDPSVLIASKPESQHMPSSRSLQSFTPKLKIKLTNSEYTSKTPVVILQNPCILSSTLLCDPDPAYTPNQISQRIKLAPSISSPYLVYEHSNSYNYPITIDIYYHTTGRITMKKYSNLNLTGTLTQSTLNSFYFSGDEGSNRSSYHSYGNIKGPKDGAVSCSLFQDDGSEVFINGIRVFQDSSYGTRTFSYTFEKDILYYIEIMIYNHVGLGYQMDFKMNVNGSFERVDGNYITNPVRISGMPYLLTELKYDTYCDDVSGFRCVVCDGLCVECEDNSSIKTCTSCKVNAHVSNGQCVCDAKFYLSASDPDNCQACTGLCEECDYASGSYICKSCKPNATLNSSFGTCTCNPSYYLSISDPENCQSCTELCGECEDTGGVYICKACKANASLDSFTGVCSCNEGYYLLATGECIPCNPSCSRCEEISGTVVCLACKEYARLESGNCICIEGYYQEYSNLSTFRCYECPGMCRECNEDMNGIHCISCIEGLIVNDGYCECKDSNYIFDEITYECNLCDEEDFTISNGTCNAKEFTLSLKPSLNKLEITFNKHLIDNLNLSSLNHAISQTDLQPYLSISLLTITNRLKYAISYKSSRSIDTTISVSLLISDTVQDRQYQNLAIAYYQVSVPIFTINKAYPSTEDDKESEDCGEDYDIEYLSNIIVLVSVSVLLAVSLLNKNLYPLWSVLSLIQILKFSILLDIELPCKLRAIAKSMTFEFLPNIFEHFMKYETTSTPDRYEELGYDTTIYLLNNGDLLTILIISIAIYLLLKITLFIFKRKDSKLLLILKKVILGCEWNCFIRFIIQSYLDIAVSSSFTLKHFPRDIEIPDYISAGLSFVLICILPIYLLRFLYKSYEFLPTDEYKSKWGSLYNEFKFKSKAASYFPIVYLSRRLLYSIALSYLDFNSIIQIVVSCSSSLFVLFK